MLLLVDIGNTYTKIKLDNESNVFHIPTSKIKNVDSLKELFPKDLSFDSACISNVSKGKDLIFKEYFDELNIKSLIINKDLKFRIKYPLVNELGPDLMALMEGCATICSSFIAISLGTASVFLYVKNNEFMGCAIAPGLLSSLDGLINTASLIEDTVLSKDYELLGFDTESSLRDGILMGHAFMVDGYINAIKEENSIKEIPTFMLGGFSDTIIKNIKNEVIIDQDLIFKGMKDIYSNNEGILK